MSLRIKREDHTEIHCSDKVVFIKETVEENLSAPVHTEIKLGESQVHKIGS